MVASAKAAAATAAVEETAKAEVAREEAAAAAASAVVQAAVEAPAAVWALRGDTMELRRSATGRRSGPAARHRPRILILLLHTLRRLRAVDASTRLPRSWAAAEYAVEATWLAPQIPHRAAIVRSRSFGQRSQSRDRRVAGIALAAELAQNARRDAAAAFYFAQRIRRPQSPRAKT